MLVFNSKLTSIDAEIHLDILLQQMEIEYSKVQDIIGLVVRVSSKPSQPL